MIKPPHLPIVYVRGYAGSQGEVEDTVATPYMGFNLGSTKLRQLHTGDIQRYIFESPLIRLMKEHRYKDIYEHGAEIPPGKKVSPRSVWIYRYYEPVSKDLGSGFRPEIEDYARGLHDLIERMRHQFCRTSGATGAALAAEKKAFKVYLVAHSMGGLVVRCYLQNIWPSKDPNASPPVDKVFTYATPHGGIDFRFVGNVPGFLKVNNVENFNEKRMREYLKLPKTSEVNTLTGFDTGRFFCLVGTDHRDYHAGGDLSRRAVGPMSDGLVQIKNAYVQKAPRAFVHRAHSGHYGIVNSEGGYQNLSRFLFGDVRVDALLEIDSVTYPPKVQRKIDKGKKVKAAYHVEVIARVRGERWDLHRRVVNEQSAIFVPQQRIDQKKPVFLMSAYLMKAAKVNTRRKGLGFCIDLGVLVPEYEVDGFLFLDEHYEGGYLFRDKINLEVTPDSSGVTRVKFGFDNDSPNRCTTDAQIVKKNWGQEIRIPIAKNTKPGLTGTLVFRARGWS